MGLEQLGGTATAAPVDYDRYRLRDFIERLRDSGEIEIRSGVTPLSEIARTLEANPKAVLFETVGRNGLPLAGNVLASRTRFAAAFGVTPAKLLPEDSAAAAHQAGNH